MKITKFVLIGFAAICLNSMAMENKVQGSQKTVKQYYEGIFGEIKQEHIKETALCCLQAVNFALKKEFPTLKKTEENNQLKKEFIEARNYLKKYIK